MEEVELVKITLQQQGDWLVILQNDMYIVIKNRQQAQEICRSLDDNFGLAVCLSCGQYF